MPRLPRAVFAGLPHHVTQRGNRREDVFFNDEDRQYYLGLLSSYCKHHNVDILAYCLMTNHVHIVMVPVSEDGLQRVLKPLHMRYAQRLNRERGWKGHLWQGRFFSSPLDEAYLLAAVRYVERNPVRAGMSEKAETYQWSSAAAHCGLRDDPLLSDNAEWGSLLRSVEDWSGWISVEEESGKLEILRKHAEKGLPCGSKDFMQKLGQKIGRSLECRHQGRPGRREDKKG